MPGSRWRICVRAEVWSTALVFIRWSCLSFSAQHFLVYSPLLFLALAWGVIASWRRVNQQFKVLFLFWFGLPVFAFLSVSLSEQSRGAELGRARLSQLRPYWQSISGGTTGSQRLDYGWAPSCRSGRDCHECVRARYRSAAERRVSTSGATRSQAMDARLEMRHAARWRNCGNDLEAKLGRNFS